MKVLLSLMVMGLLVGCATGQSRNGTGLIYTDVVDSVAATTNESTGKVGQSCATNVLSLVSTGDMSIDAAKKIGGITKVSSVDFSQTSILGIFAKTCVIVKGE